MSNKAYDILKWLIAIVMPAAAVLYGNLGSDWGWYNPQLIVKTITEIQLFLGTIFAVSCYSYAKGGKG